MKHEMSAPEQWLQLYGDILYRYGLARVRYPEVAEDLLQETLLAGLKAREGYEGKSSVQTWLVGILKYKIIDYFRKTSREVTEVYEEGMMNNDSDYFDETGHWSVDFSSWSRPDKSIEQKQFMEVLQQCLNRLPPKMAQLFMLRELEGMNNEDICELMAISSINNLWVILSRTRVQLRHCLDIQWFNQ